MHEMMRRIRRAPATALLGLAQLIWKYHGAGQLDDATADLCATEIHIRQRNSRFETRRDRKFYKIRDANKRRRLAAAGGMPPELAQYFTISQQAVLFVVSQECAQQGYCSLTIGEISDKAQVGETTVHDALRNAERHGFISRQQRKRFRMPNLPSIVRILSFSWLQWLSYRVRKHKHLNQSDIKGSLTRETVNRLPYPLFQATPISPMNPQEQGGSHVSPGNKGRSRGTLGVERPGMAAAVS